MVTRKNKSILMVAVLGLMLGLSGCVRSGSKKTRVIQRYHSEKDNIAVVVTKFGAKDATRVLKTDTRAAGYQPLALWMHNKSDDTLIFRASTLDVPLSNPDDAAYNTQSEAMWLGLSAGYLAALFYWPAVIPAGALTGWMLYKNHQVANTIKSVGLYETDTIQLLPYEQFTRVAFVPTDLKINGFRFTVYNVEKKAFVPFRVVFSNEHVPA